MVVISPSSAEAQDTPVGEAKQVTTTPVSRMEQEWWKNRHEQKLATAAEMDHVDLVLLGDSITHSWESGGKDVWNEIFGDLATLNLGFSGDRTEHVLWRLENGEVDRISPAAVMILIGTNNTGHRLDKPQEIADGIEAIVDELKQRLPETKILLLAVFPYGKDPKSKRRRNNEAVNEMICKFHDGQRVHYLDICKKFFNDNGDMTAEITPDFLHLSPAGYRIWAENVKGPLQELMQND